MHRCVCVKENERGSEKERVREREREKTRKRERENEKEREKERVTTNMSRSCCYKSDRDTYSASPSGRTRTHSCMQCDAHTIRKLVVAGLSSQMGP